FKNGKKLEDVSLNIPGNKKRIKTDETLTVILDFGMKDYKGSSCVAELDLELNVVFVAAQVEPKHSPTYPSPRIIKIINSMINLGKDIMYKTIQTQMENRVVALAFHKNPENAPPINFP
nr:RNA-directed DNA polymerase, eukaryota, reverse transcriptase zinc-binding domain protein [Tanacetum cinerariifolium]